eukprot:TRINITY_DN63466_c0_g1_i1.p1 TRINITY_DN63466_c0_g1~~TRINITY_DN63466_c0_g1_i1.p1  ORF type:complete len:354 (+),score=83.79 TRINITY_DN63466_c0_g1_i1:134-1195(+)
MASSLYVGHVKSWNPTKGWGHISCAETQQLYGKDVFLLRSALNDTNVSVGEAVAFSVVDNGRGPEAASARSVAGVAPALSTPAASSLPADAASQGLYAGIVKSWNPVKGWGHIVCEQTQALFGKDMFFMKSQVIGDVVLKGAQVTFAVSHGLKGPEAANVTMVRSRDASGAALALDAAALKMSSKKVYYGAVKNYAEEKGWGFVECQNTFDIYGKDMFFLRSALGGNSAQQGDSVQFQVTTGAKGPEATALRVLTSELGCRHSGSVKQYDTEKGFGFIACDRLRNIFERDVFIHSKELSGYVPVVGTSLTFVLAIAADGRPEATCIGFDGDLNAVAANYKVQRNVVPRRQTPY